MARKAPCPPCKRCKHGSAEKKESLRTRYAPEVLKLRRMLHKFKGELEMRTSNKNPTLTIKKDDALRKMITANKGFYQNISDFVCSL